MTGVKDITCLSYLYPVKRIKNRPVKYLEDDTFLMLLQAEELGYIKTTFKVQEAHKQDKKNVKEDEILI